MDTHGLFLSGSQETLWLHAPVATEPLERLHQIRAIDVLDQDYAKKTVAHEQAYLIACDVKSLGNLESKRIGERNLPNAVAAISAAVPVRNDSPTRSLIEPIFLSDMTARFEVSSEFQAWLDQLTPQQVAKLKHVVEPALGQLFIRSGGHTPRGKLLLPEISHGGQETGEGQRTHRSRVPILRAGRAILQPSNLGLGPRNTPQVAYELRSTHESDARTTLSLVLGIAALTSYAITQGVRASARN